MKYNYNAQLGCFERSDGLGKKIWVTMSEAQRIITLRELGNSIGEIQAKMNFVSSKATSYSVKTILAKYDNGAINIDMNVPAPDIQFNDLGIEERISSLEQRLSKLEEAFYSIKWEDNKSFMEKVKLWIK